MAAGALWSREYVQAQLIHMGSLSDALLRCDYPINLVKERNGFQGSGYSGSGSNSQVSFYGGYNYVTTWLGFHTQLLNQTQV